MNQKVIRSVSYDVYLISTRIIGSQAGCEYGNPKWR